MAYMPGGSLRDRLAVGDRPDPERIATELLRAVEHIHANGIVHRDVKPGNVLLDPQGTACLSDFGIARPEDATSITRTGQIPGTGAYMAPELWRGEPATERSDLYSAGVLLGEYLVADADRPLTELVARLTAEDPEVRPESASAALSMITTPPGRPPTHRTSRSAASADHSGTFDRTTEIAAERPAAAATAPAPVPGERRWAPVLALCAVALAAGIAVSQALDGGGATPVEEAIEANRDAAQRPAEAPDAQADAAADAEPSASENPPVLGAEEGAALNDKGFELIGSGRYEEAIPILERAVDALSADTSDQNYAYALYNLGNAYFLAGRAEEAIPILEQRLQIPNQKGTVKKTLAAAQAAVED